MSAVYCRCGAQWHGEYARIGNIDYHKRRQERGDTSCEIIEHDMYLRLFARKCGCAECKKKKGSRLGPKARIRNAAPELLAALKRVLVYVEDFESGKPCEDGIAARAAIAKAEGRDNG